MYKMSICDINKHLKAIENMNDDGVQNYLNDKKLWYFDVIYTFDKIEQKFIDIVIPEIKQKENRRADNILLNQLFQFLSQEELKQLVKISTCKHYTTILPNFLENRNGKYFFNVERNNSSDTEYNRDFRDSRIF